LEKRKAQESVSVTVPLSEASRIALSMSDGNTQKPTLVYAINAYGYISLKISRRKHENYISMGIYRCSTLDIDMNFARIPESQESARINAFHNVCILPFEPMTRAPRSLHRKNNIKFCKYNKLIQKYSESALQTAYRSGLPCLWSTTRISRHASRQDYRGYTV
jgi:hypothetical protein